MKMQIKASLGDDGSSYVKKKKIVLPHKANPLEIIETNQPGKVKGSVLFRVCPFLRSNGAKNMGEGGPPHILSREVSIGLNTVTFYGIHQPTRLIGTLYTNTNRWTGYMQSIWNESRRLKHITIDP